MYEGGGGLGFIRSNPALGAYNEMNDRLYQTRQRDQAEGVDRAIRGGVSEMARQTPAGGPLAAVRAAPAAGAPQTPRGASILDQGPAPAAGSATAGGEPGDEFYPRLASAESGGVPTARNPRSSATGTFQFIDSTWRQFAQEEPQHFAGMTPEQIMAARTDPVISRHGARWYARRNTRDLASSGQQATPVNLALAHGFGSGGALALLRADPNAPFESAIPNAEAVLRANPHLRGQTVGQVIASYAARHGGGTGVASRYPGSVDVAGPGAPPAAPSSSPLTAVQAPSAAPPTPTYRATDYNPILSRLAQTPGGGQAALRLLQAQSSEQSRLYAAQIRSRQQTVEDRILAQALARGDVATAQWAAGRQGIQLPESVLQNAPLMRLTGIAQQIASRHYDRDPDQAQAFAIAYVQSGGNLERAFQAAGVPRTRLQNWSFQWMQNDHGQMQLIGLDRRTGETMTPTVPGAPAAAGPAPSPPPAAAGPEPAPSPAPAGPAAAPTPGQPGAPITRAPGTGSQARVADRELRRRMLVEGGMDPQQAALIAGGAAMTAAQRAQAFRSFRTAAERDVVVRDPARREEEIRRRVDAAMAALDADVAANAPRAAQPAPAAPATPPVSAPQVAPRDQGTAPPPAPAGPQAAPPAAAQQQYRLPDGQVGELVESRPDGSRVYRLPNGRRFTVRSSGT